MWLILALAAAVFWGATYVLDEQVYRHVSVPTTMAIHTLIISVCAWLVAWKQGTIESDFQILSTSRVVAWLFFWCAVTFVIAEFLINFSISAKNATLAGLIEISYPIFSALFAYLVFGENQLNFGTSVGGLFIAFGVVVVYWFSP
ncbi:EamA family transporter [Bradyrhizobium sp. CSA207]|uniref:EamA family transporter n=1 Tax=Bradyrhizobium sp. CSA207 TaxID=2698826 RepID=UPI0023AFE070|nr:DMT family transporter [Bradyrhizobium sp. CSA207]MDE5446375.1 EamA family transporter [Bradyrhizobium sp. CSA207]